MKQFIFYRLVDRENICGLKKESTQLNKLVERKQNIVLYAPRNFGKTSLVTSVVIPDFQKKHSKSLVFFVDLMGVRDAESIVVRLKHSLEKAIKEAFPLKNIISSIGDYLANLKIKIVAGASSDSPTLTLECSGGKGSKTTIGDIFESLSKINQKVPVLIVIDEFQDVSLVEEAESLFRDAFQRLKAVPIIILGSKKHLLKNIFTLPKSPLANWGHDVVIEPIDYEDYHDYIGERFKIKKLRIDSDSSRFLQDSLNRVPEAVNLICYEILQANQKQSVDKELINKTLNDVLKLRSKRFETILSSLSKSEEKILVAIAQAESISQPQGKDFANLVSLTPRSIKLNMDKLMNHGIIDCDNGSYMICDPLLNLYLRNFR